MAGTNRGDTYAAMIAALDEQAGLVRELEELCGRQKTMIAGDDADGVLGLLSTRQAVIDRLVELDGRMASLRAGGDESEMEAGQRQEISHRAQAVAGAIQRVLASDAADREILEQRRGVLATQLAEISGKRRAIKAYGGKGTGQGAMFQDRRG